MAEWEGLQYFTTVRLLLTVEDACYRVMSLCRYRSCDPEQGGYAGKSLFKRGGEKRRWIRTREMIERGLIDDQGEEWGRQKGNYNSFLTIKMKVKKYKTI